MGNLVIKNDSFIQSMHNNIQCIESLDPNDKGTSRQYWFSASMLANIFDISRQAVKNNIDFLEKWGEVTVVKNFTTVQMRSSSGAVKDNVLLLRKLLELKHKPTNISNKYTGGLFYIQ